MNLTKIAIDNNRVTYIILLMIIVMSIVGYNTLSRDSMPPYTVRVATVVTSFPGAGPERVESLISDKIEKVVQELPELDYVSSQSRTGLSVIVVALKDNVKAVELQPVWDKLRRKIDGIRNDLPSGIYGPEVKDEDVGVVYGIMLGMESDGFEYAQIKEYADNLKDKLIALENAAKVEIGGEIEERVYIEFNDSELAKYGLSGSQLKNNISSTNIIIAAGEVKLGNERIILEPSGNLESIEDIKNILVPIGDGETIKLNDLTTVRQDYISPKETMVLINGNPALSLSISLKKGANIIQLGETVNELLIDYNKTLPLGLSVTRIASQDTDVEYNISNFVSNVMQSIVIVLLVMFIFLGLRTGLVVASLIPLVILCTLLIMGVLNVGLNQVSLAALIMALGMLVDNAIVIAETMMVKMEKGTKAITAAIESSSELMFPLLISSLTTSAAFLAFYLAESVMGEVMGELFVVITIALISSWLMALTIIPLLAIKMIRIKESKDQKPSIFDKLNVYYNKLLKTSIKKPLITIGIIVICFFVSLVGFKMIPVNFMPDSERNLVTLDLNLPLGTSIESTQEEIKKIETYIKETLLVSEKKEKGILDWSSFIGKGPNSYDLGYRQEEANSSYAHILVNTSSGDENQMVIDSLEQFCFKNLLDADVTIKRLGSSGGAASPIEVRIKGPEIVDLYEIVNQVKTKLREIPGAKSIDDDWGPRIKKFEIKVDQNKLSQSGFTNQDIAVSLNAALSGQKVGDFRDGDNTIPITMKSSISKEILFSNIETISIFAQGTGRNIPLSQIATIVPEWQYAKILRRDLNRTITVNCRLENGVTANDITNVLTPWLEEKSEDWNNNYSYELGGDSESSSKAMSAVGEKLPIAFFIIILLLVIQFNSIRKLSIILLTIPLGIIGIVAGLLLTRSFFSFTAFLGVISLAGIVINNAIVLIDTIEVELKNESRTPMEALIHSANGRFRPILLTTFTTSLGLIPLWIGGGDMWRPMAIGIIFGLLFATVITLLFVPIMYMLFYKKEFKDA